MMNWSASFLQNGAGRNEWYRLMATINHQPFLCLEVWVSMSEMSLGDNDGGRNFADEIKIEEKTECI